MKRREFIALVGVSGVATYLPVAIAASATENSALKTVASNVSADGFESVGTVAELDKNGQILNKKFSKGKVLVVRNPDDPNAILAVNPVCTHDGCDVKWETDDKEFKCPCHDAEFATDGQVKKGPAKKPLRVYEAKQEGDAILVKAI